jgi:hypothetical protein
MAQANVEADPMFQLLTDALRAGPGSPEWHQAVGKLRAGGMNYADEYQMLIEAREHLESGKEYRSVRAGAGFTRKLLEGIDKEEPPGAARPGWLPTANVIAALSAMAILAVLAFVVYQLWPTPTPEGGGGATVAELENAFFPTQVAVATFDEPPVAATGESPEPPAGWTTIGQLKLETARPGLRPSAARGPATGPVGGGVVAAATIDAKEPFAAEASLRFGRPADDLIVEFFVSADPAGFSADRATSSDELVWSLQGSRQQVFLDGRQAAEDRRPEPPRPDPSRPGGDTGSGVPVRILVNRDAAIVEVNKRRLWSGPHGLAAHPRHVGVRFLRVGGSGRNIESVVVQAIKVVKK